MAVLLGLGFVYLARALFYRPWPPVSWRERADRMSYWFGRVLGVVLVALGAFAVVLELVLLALG